MALDDATLREAASHRGLKLVKSRKRKPGSGDYGHFGLTDASGKALFGISDDGLTATAQEITAFLRKGEATTWAESAKVTPARIEQRKPRDPTLNEDDAPASAIRPRPKAKRRASEERQPERVPTDVAKPNPVAKTRTKDAEPPAESAPVQAPTPALVVRTARSGDAKALVRILGLVGFSGTKSDMGRSIAAASRRKEPILVADRGDLLGCVVWHIVPTVQEGSIARITALVVDESARREGIGRALYEAAATEFARQGVDRIEAMSEIEVRNTNGFFRALGLSQASYRFVSKS